MSDNPNKRGKPDRNLVSQQKHEIDYLAKKHDLPPPLVKKVVAQEGPSRKSVDKYLDTMKKNGKK